MEDYFRKQHSTVGFLLTESPPISRCFPTAVQDQAGKTFISSTSAAEANEPSGQTVLDCSDFPPLLVGDLD